jgi:outer membrane lipoprotein-sorting protein
MTFDMKRNSPRLALVVAILLIALPIVAQSQTKPDAKEILENMFKAYSRFASYQDEGILITTKDEATGGTIEKMPFKTFYKRPDLFRFEWTDYAITKLGRTKVIWSNGKEAFTYWEPDNYEKEKSLSMAVAGATGITSQTVNTVHDLLIQEEFESSRLKHMVNVSLVGEEEFEGVSCYRIKGVEGDEPFDLWIGKTDFLLRKLRRESKIDDTLWIYEEIRRKIQVDQPIAEVVFNYKPPIPLTPKKDTNTTDIDKILNPGPPLWTEFKSVEGQFSILMPQKPVSRAATVETPEGRVEQHIFIATHDLMVCMVGYSDIPKPAVVASNADAFFDGLQEQFIKELDGKLESQNSLSLDGHRGREVTAQLFRGKLRMRMFLVANRLYFMSLINSNKDAASDEETFKKFFTSFKLNSVTKPVALRKSNPSWRILA